MIYELGKIKDADIKNKMVLLRADLDVPLANGKISDDMRLQASVETIRYLLGEAKTVIIIGHLGRPDGKDDKFSLKPVAEWIFKQFKLQNSELRIKDIEGLMGWEITDKLILLENLRFYKEEEKNDLDFSQKLASLAEIYVNDAFASSHRVHASIVGITKYLPSFAGLRLEKEVQELSKVLENPKRPLVVIIGGAKIETKLPLVEKMHHFADYVLVGGEIAENDKVLLKVQHEKITGRKSILLVADLMGDNKDITIKSAENFLQVCQDAGCVVWNGPMGQVENENYQAGTEILAKGLSSSNSYKIVGGGDTIAYLKKINLLEKFDFVSTGGGAMLEFLAGVKLPGVVVLKK